MFDLVIVAVVFFVIGFVVRWMWCPSCEKNGAKPKSGGGPGEESDQPPGP